MQDPQETGNESHEPNGHPARSRIVPPPPSLVPAGTPGWSSHISALPFNQLPRAPTSFTFSTDLPTDGALAVNSSQSSSTFTDYLQMHSSAYAAPDHSLTQQIRPHSQLSQTSILNYPYNSFSPFAPYNSSLDISRIPLVPQDVEYQQGYPTHQPVQHPAALPTTESSNSHLDDGPGYVYPPLEDFSITVNEFDRQECVTTPTATTRKRKRADFTGDTNAASSDQPGSKAKKPRRTRSRALQVIDPELDAPSEDEATEQSKPRKEPKSRGRVKGQKVGPRPTLDPGPEFMALYNQAMDAFIEHGDLFVAQTQVLQAIAVNPEIFAAHSLLADIHFAKGDHDKGFDALMSGLHAHMNDVELWKQVADTILASNQETSQKRVERAMYCFGAILRKEPTDMDARFQRAECARVLGQVNRAFSDLNVLLQHDPHNSSVLAQFTQLCSDVNDPQKARLLYDGHFEYYRTNGISEEDCFSWQDIGVYIDLLAQAGELGQAVIMLKRLSRWLCGRSDEEFWEEYVEDDREFDQTHYPRRLELDQFEPTIHPEQDYGEALPLDLRAKLGILRLKLNYHEEARSHFDWLEPELEEEESLVDEYSDAFLEIAKALFEAKEYKEALRFYDALRESGLDLNLDFWIGLGACAYICEQKDKAIQAYEQALVINPESIDPRTQLAKLYRDLGNRTSALKYGREAVIMSQNAIPQTGNRMYESKENRIMREAAERALKGAYRLPTGPKGAPGKVPESLKYRGRYKSRYVKYVPRDTEEPHPEENASRNDDDDSTQQPHRKSKKSGPQNRRGKKVNSPRSGSTKDPKDSIANQEREWSASSRDAGNEDVESTNATPGIDESQHTPRVSESDRKTFKRRYRKRPSMINPEKRYQDVQVLYAGLLRYQTAMREGDEEATVQWMDCAQALIDDFRTVKDFFPGERHARFKGFAGSTVATGTPTTLPSSEQQLSVIGAASVSARESVQLEDNGTRAATPSRLVDEGVVNEYCGLSFSAWLDVFLELAIVIANYPVFQNGIRDLQTDCYTIINAAIDCNVFYHHAPSLAQIYFVYLACCLALNDDVTLYNTVLRWFMNEFTFCTDTYRLYSTVALLREYSNIEGKSRIEGSMYRDSSNQKFLFRQLCSIDQQLPKDYGLGTSYGPVPGFMRRERDGLRAQKGKKGTDPSADAAREAGDETPFTAITRQASTSEPGTPMAIPRHNRLANMVAIKSFSPKEMDVVLFILYSHIMMANNSFTNALNYLYRAHSLDPTNTVCLLSMAFCYLTELFKRQVSNRHALSLMGWMWFGRYEIERRKWAEQIDSQLEDHNLDAGATVQVGKVKMIDVVNREIEFNRARCWEMLGMPDLAVRGYKKMLSLPGGKDDKMGSDDQTEESTEGPAEIWDMEAAYAMSTIYMVNGDGQMAREIVERYMVVE